MPAPGEQHLSNSGPTITNPFEEMKPRVSEYTAKEIATLQSRLEKQLGPEYISWRSGPSGGKVPYLAGEKCIQLANEVFGFNGWSSSIMNLQVDFVDENPTTMRVSLGLSVIVRITLRDGTFHEDIGYGHIENAKGKAAAFEKAKKEGTTDGLKRALRNFGNVLGNCIYDKEYLAKVSKVKIAPTKWDVDGLHRHSDYAPVKKEAGAPIMEEVKQNGLSVLSKSESEDIRTTVLVGVPSDFLDDEFGDFDEADFGVSHEPDSHPDEVALPFNVSSHDFTGGNFGNTTHTVRSANLSGQTHQVRPPANRMQVMPAPARPHTGIQATDANGGRTGPQPQQPQQELQTSNTGFVRSTSGAGAGTQMRPPQEANAVSRVVQATSAGLGRVLNQPSRIGPLPAPDSPAQYQKPPLGHEDESPGHGLPYTLETGFFSAKAATMLPEGPGKDGLPPAPPGNLPTFNPHAESPSIRKTPGVDHNRSKPLNKELKHVPGSIQAMEAAANTPMRTNIVNPQLDATRRIGTPGSPSPMANRGMYKPPTMKRPNQGLNPIRSPLGDLPANGAVSTADEGGDMKRQRLNGP